MNASDDLTSGASMRQDGPMHPHTASAMADHLACIQAHMATGDKYKQPLKGCNEKVCKMLGKHRGMMLKMHNELVKTFNEMHGDDYEPIGEEMQEEEEERPDTPTSKGDEDDDEEETTPKPKKKPAKPDAEEEEEATEPGAKTITPAPDLTPGQEALAKEMLAELRKENRQLAKTLNKALGLPVAAS